MRRLGLLFWALLLPPMSSWNMEDCCTCMVRFFCTIPIHTNPAASKHCSPPGFEMGGGRRGLKHAKEKNQVQLQLQAQLQASRTLITAAQIKSTRTLLSSGDVPKLATILSVAAMDALAQAINLGGFWLKLAGFFVGWVLGCS